MTFLGAIGQVNPTFSGKSLTFGTTSTAVGGYVQGTVSGGTPTPTGVADDSTSTWPLWEIVVLIAIVLFIAYCIARRV